MEVSELKHLTTKFSELSYRETASNEVMKSVVTSFIHSQSYLNNIELITEC